MTAKPVRLQLSRRKGFSLQALSLATNGLPAVNVTRNGINGGMFGNPWKVGSHPGFSRDQVVALHATWLKCEASDADVGPEAAARRKVILSSLHLIRGKNLACTCSSPAPYERDNCHAATLLGLANPDSGGR